MAGVVSLWWWYREDPDLLKTNFLYSYALKGAQEPVLATVRFIGENDRL